MTPILFGPLERRLFGVFHAANSARTTGAAVLLCYPFGHEVIRSHRFFRLLADRLARQGVAALRFDYYGTGDSQGADEDGDLQGWSADVCEADRELRSRSHASTVTWFGARLGASLALQAAARTMPRPERLVLWDPVLDGPAYLQEMRRSHLEELELGHHIPDAAWRRAFNTDPLAFTDECYGFAISAALRQQIQALDATHAAPAAARQITVIAQPTDQAAQNWMACQPSGTPKSTVKWLPFKHPLIWLSNPYANNEVAPAEALRTMLSELS